MTAFEEAPGDHQWPGKLGAMIKTLRRRYRSTVGDRWEWFIVKRGAVISYREVANSRGEIRIARDQPLLESQRAAWDKEVWVFCAAWSIVPVTGTSPCDGDEWLIQEPHAEDEGKTAMRLLELRPGEVTPGHAVCWDCLQKTGELVSVPWFCHGGPSGQRCNQCALKAGQREEEEREGR